MRVLFGISLVLFVACSSTTATPVATAVPTIPLSPPNTVISSPTITPGASTPTQTAQPSPTRVPPTATRTQTAVPASTAAPTVTATLTATRAASTNTPAAASLRIELAPVVTGLTRPVYVGNAGDGSGRLFVIEKPGRIRIIRDGALLAQSFLDITSLVGSRGNEQGLLGLAFHPQYKSNGQFFVNYTDVNGDTVIARYHVSSDPDRADPNSASLVLTVDQPFPNHNGGNLVFGPDGYLYIGLGDGGSAGDPNRNGQNLNALLGKMLRVDVNGAAPYAIPNDNPFVNRAGARPEIWALGLRNPWRYSFDRATGDLYIGDVGQNSFEEIDLQLANAKGGQNYGWNIMEGLHCFRATTCDQTGLTLPITEYPTSSGCAVTGGFVYRGKQFAALAGQYVFTDYCNGILWTLPRDASGKWTMTQRGQTDASVSSFGEDEAGEIYATDDGGGRVLRLSVTGQ